MWRPTEVLNGPSQRMLHGRGYLGPSGDPDATGTPASGGAPATLPVTQQSRDEPRANIETLREGGGEGGGDSVSYPACPAPAHTGPPHP